MKDEPILKIFGVVFFVCLAFYLFATETDDDSAFQIRSCLAFFSLVLAFEALKSIDD